MSVEAIRLNKGTWIKKMNACCNNFGWQNVGMEQVKDMSENELKKMLESVAWRRKKRMESGIREQTKAVDAEEDCGV